MKIAINESPTQLSQDVFYCGGQTNDMSGGKSYVVLHKYGNWMVDSSNYSQALVDWLHEHGGLKYIFLTHRGDVGEEYDYAWEFGARRIMHAADAEAVPNAEIVLDGLEERTFERDFIAIPTPGHTPGHCSLLYKNEVLFSGDMLTATTRFTQGLEISDPFYCWWSWSEQTRSAERLLNFDFVRTLPAHGLPFKTDNVKQMRTEVESVINQCRNEQSPDPATPERIQFFELMTAYADDREHTEWSKITQMRLKELKSRLQLG